MSEIPFLDSWLTSCAGRRTSEHCALSAMLTVSQLSKSFAGRALFDDVSLQVNRGDLIKFQSRSFDSSKLCVYIFVIWVRQLLFVRQKSWRDGLSRRLRKWGCPKDSSSART